MLCPTDKTDVQMELIADKVLKVKGKTYKLFLLNRHVLNNVDTPKKNVNNIKP